MGLSLIWFKGYIVKDDGMYMNISFKDTDKYHMCYSNANIVSHMFKQIKSIPSIGDFENVDKLTVNEVIKQIEDELISPQDMVKICNTLLSDVSKFIEPYFNKDKMDDINDLISYINMIKRHSEEGYYFAFELE